MQTGWYGVVATPRDKFTYYVDPAGSDAANGLTPATAWATVAKVNGTTLTAGQSVGFKRGGSWGDGLTIGNSGSAGSPIRFGAYGAGAAPILTGSGAVTSFSSLGSNVYSKVVTDNPNGVVFINSVFGIEVTDQASVNGTAKWFYNTGTTTLYVYSVGTPTVTVAAVQKHGIRITAASYIVIENLKVTQFAGRGIWFESSGNHRSIYNCESSYNGYQGFYCGYDGNLNDLHDGCSALYNQEGGCQIVGATETGIQNIEVRNGVYRFNKQRTTTQGDQLRFAEVNSGLNVHHNKVYRDPNLTSINCDGIDIASNAHGALIHHNEVFGYISCKNTTNGAKFYNNSVYAQVAPSDQTIGFYVNLGCSNLVFKNNVIYVPALNGDGYGILVDSTSAAGLVCDYNRYYCPNGAAVARISEVSYQTLANFQATGQEAHGAYGDPLFTDPSSKDLTLQSGSPCINAGVVIPGITDGYLGVAPDLGAFEKA